MLVNSVRRLQDEAALLGGRVTPGVVRVGDTVRRPPAPNAAFVRSLLRHLADRGFDAAPLSLGADESGREMFSFISGDVPTDLAFHDDATLSQASALIRRFHDLAAELVSSQAAVAVGIETVCHNDLSPCNFVFREGRPSAIIDFDAAAPGSRAFDLGYAAWLWLDIGAPNFTVGDQRRRLSVFIDGYGGFPRAELIEGMIQRQTALLCRAKNAGDAAMETWATSCREWMQRAYAGMV